MQRPLWARALDVGIMASLFVLSVWVYELWNFLVLAVTGAQVYVVLSGPLPAGLVGVSSSSQPFIVAKLAQTFLCSVTFLGLFLMVRKRDLPLTKLASACTIGFSLASIQWEFLATAYAYSFAFQTIAFMLLAVVFSVIIVRSFFWSALSEGGFLP